LELRIWNALLCNSNGNSEASIPISSLLLLFSVITNPKGKRQKSVAAEPEREITVTNGIPDLHELLKRV